MKHLLAAYGVAQGNKCVVWLLSFDRLVREGAGPRAKGYTCPVQTIYTTKSAAGDYSHHPQAHLISGSAGNQFCHLFPHAIIDVGELSHLLGVHSRREFR